MGKFSVIPQNAFDELQTEAGVLLSDFDPSSGAIDDEDIICATKGGIKAVCRPTYRDNGQDVDNCPPNMKELKEILYYECRLDFTALSMTPETFKLSIGAASASTITAGKGSKISPKHELTDADFKDIWWVGDKSDGGMVAVCLKNALSADGFSIQTDKDSKGQLSVSMLGHYSITAQKTVPMEFYVADATAST